MRPGKPPAMVGRTAIGTAVSVNLNLKLHPENVFNVMAEDVILRFDNVIFEYAEKKPVLNEVCFWCA